MSNDLLFSVLPRQGTVPIAHDEHIVEKVTKTAALRTLNDEEQELHLEERESREKQQSQAKKKPVEAAKEADSEQKESDDKPDKGFKHLDIYV